MSTAVLTTLRKRALEAENLRRQENEQAQREQEANDARQLLDRLKEKLDHLGVEADVTTHPVEVEGIRFSIDDEGYLVADVPCSCGAMAKRTYPFGEVADLAELFEFIDAGFTCQHVVRVEVTAEPSESPTIEQRLISVLREFVHDLYQPF